jgi:hypothetical protein
MIPAPKLKPTGAPAARPTSTSDAAQSAASVLPIVALPIQSIDDVAALPTVHFDQAQVPGWRAALSNSLGTPLTHHNPVWTPRAIGLLRRLQQRLLDTARQEDGAARRLMLNAVDVVEEQVRWRLWLQSQETGAGLSGFAEAPP